MNLLSRIPIRFQLLLIVMIVALPAAGIIVNAGIQQRKEALHVAKKDTQKLAERIAYDQQSMIASARQLMASLAQMPEVKRKDAAKVTTLLSEIHRLNPEFTNIFVADRSGMVWATAVPVKPPFIISDRRYFKNTLAHGHLSSGEYIVARATNRPSFTLGYPIKDQQGDITGVIAIGFLLEKYTHLLERSNLPWNASFVLLDHQGVILYRAIDPEKFIGKQSDPVLFKLVSDAPDESTSITKSLSVGDERIISTRKLRLEGEATPYMYVRVGIPVESAVANANTQLLRNMIVFIGVLLVAFLFSGYIAERSIVTRILLLEKASQSLAQGDYQTKIADLVQGGELGSLAASFDTMAYKLIEREEALAGSERFLSAIIDTEPECIKLLDADNNLLMMNRAGLEMIEADTLEQVQGQCIATVITEPYRDAFIALGRQVFLGKPGTLEFIATGLRGRHIWLDTHAVPFCNEHGEIVSLLGVTRDITERKLAETALLQAKEAAEAANQAKSRFLANMSHELRTPMNGVLGMIQLTQSGPLETKQRNYLDMAYSSGRALVRILNDILDLTRIEERKLSLLLEPFSLRECVDGTISMLTPEAVHKGLLLGALVEADVPETITGDQVRLQQVLTNLVGNAVKFTEQGTVTARVALAPRGLIFTVTDTGIGIPVDKQNLLFKPFSQVDDSMTRRYGGTGLGLVICKEIVELMGGTITLESTEGQGSTFSFTLPLVQATQSPEQLHPVSLPVTGSDPPFRKGAIPRILIVEDDHTNRALLQMALKRKQYVTETASNGLQALEKWESGVYDLIIMDVRMPVMDGFAATGAIREKERERGGHIPILAMTAHAFDDDAAWCLASGMDAYLSKPVDLTEVIEVVGKLVRKPGEVRTACVNR